MRILIADDEQSIVDLLTIYLEREGYECLRAEDGQEALEILDRDATIDLALLDINMPKKDGLEVLTQLRSQASDLPVIFISAKNSPQDRIQGLMKGAHDYIIKPFDPLEVIFKVKSVMQNRQVQAQPSNKQGQDKLKVKSLEIDRRAHSVTTTGGEEIKLTSLEFNILYLLASNTGQVFSADEIAKAIWEDGSGSSKTVMVHVSNLRNKLDAACKPDKIIQTVWGVGYKIEE